MQTKCFVVSGTHQVLKLDVEILFDSKSCVWHGFVEVRVQVTDHLSNEETHTKSHSGVSTLVFVSLTRGLLASGNVSTHGFDGFQHSDGVSLHFSVGLTELREGLAGVRLRFSHPDTSEHITERCRTSGARK